MYKLSISIRSFCLQVRPYCIIDTGLNEQITTSVVPQKWVNNDTVLCPLTAIEEESASKAYKDPDKTWQVLPCVIRKTYGKVHICLSYRDNTSGFKMHN